MDWPLESWRRVAINELQQWADHVIGFVVVGDDIHMANP